MITAEILHSICPLTSIDRLNKFAPYFNEFMPKYDINTIIRQRHFISQVAHESGGFNYVKEIASGKAYEGRKDLGNIQSGDGIKFKGRGLIQITGHNNYDKCSLSLFNDIRLLEHPELLEQSDNAVKSACWFWQSNNINKLADTDSVIAVTKKINGGTNGLAERILYYKRAQKFIV